MPAQVLEPFSKAMSETMLLPTAVLVLGLVAALCFDRPRHQQASYAAAVADRSRSRSAP